MQGQQETTTMRAWRSIAEQAKERLDAIVEEGGNAYIIYHPEVKAIDTMTGAFFLEVRGDLVKAGPPPLQELEIIETFYGTVVLAPSKLVMG
jgi:hypothetical protein